MNLKKLKNNKKGFTLIEIIVVVVILAVLMAVAVPAVMSYLDEADNAKYETLGRSALIAVQTEYAKDYADDHTVDSNNVVSKAITRVCSDGDYEEDDITISYTSNDNKHTVTQVVVNYNSKTITVDANKSVKVS